LLYLNLVLLFINSACDPIKKSQLGSYQTGIHEQPEWSSPFLKGFEKGLFRTSMEVTDKRLTGISIIKKTSDSSFHFTFANEIGMTYFDIELYRKSYRADYVFDPINNKAFLKILHRDFYVLLFSNCEQRPTRKYIPKSGNEEVFYYIGLNLCVWINPKDNSLTRLAGWSNYFDEAIINLKEYDNGFPDEIQIENPRISMVLTLSLLGH